MVFKRLGIFLLMSSLAACGGSGSGWVDFSSETVVEDLQTQLTSIDPNVTVVSNGDGSINLTNGSDTLVIKPNEASSAVITLSGTMYNVQISASGEYTFSPVSAPSSTSEYITSAKTMIGYLDDVSTKLGVDAVTGVVDLTTGTKNAAAKTVPYVVTLTGTGTSTIGGAAGGITLSGTQDASQTLTITHNFVDDSVKAAQTAGWDGTGVNVTTLDSKTLQNFFSDHATSSSITGTITLDDGTTKETVTLDETATSTLSISHGAIVEALATGSDWKAGMESALGITLNSDCSGSDTTQTSGGITLQTNFTYSSNYCGKVGVATGANASFSDLATVDWDDLIKEKNSSGKVEVLNYSFGDSGSGSLDFTDNKNVLIVKSAGNDSEPPNGYDIFGDGKNVEGTTDIFENIDIALIGSAFADNMLVVGALDANDEIAAYSTIAGASYDGSSYGFIVDDGTVSVVLNATTTSTGNLKLTYEGSTVVGAFDATLTDTLTVTTQGTSFAAPRVSGKMAITSQKFPNLDAEQLVNLAKHTATDLGVTGVDQIYGHGKINLTGMLSPIGRLN